jgi:hypothetical protein
MDAIQAVLDLAKECEALDEKVSEYEEVFESLIDKYVTLKVKSDKKTRYVDCVVSEWDDETFEWVLTSVESPEETFRASFDDFAAGTMWMAEEEEEAVEN